MTIFGRGYGFLPTQVSGCVLWLRADQGITLNGGTAQAWADLSGNGGDVSNVTAANQPTLITSDPAYNGQATLSFINAAPDAMSSPTFVVTQPNTYVFVGEADIVGGANSQFIDSAAGPNRQIVGSDASGNLILYAGNTLNSTTPTNSKCIVMVGFNGANTKAYVNGSITAAISGNVGANSSNISVGGRTGGYLQGKVAEVICYNRVLATNEAIMVNRYLGARYGILVP
jgi:hypothetical protein